MNAPSARYVPAVFLDRNRRPLLVFARGRVKFHAISVQEVIKPITLDSLRDLVPAKYRDGDYPPKRAASFWLNHTERPITPRAKAVLRGLVARKSQASAG